MNIGYPCECGSRRVHAVLKKYYTTLTVDIVCLKCGNSYSEDVAMDGLDWVDWKRFKQIFEQKERYIPPYRRRLR